MLAEKGFTVVCGGLGGVMEAVCRGAFLAGGFTVGILPGSDPGEANRWVSLAVPTGMGASRNRIVALAGKVVVAVGGRYGTLSEIAFALDAGKPVCCIGGWTGIEGVVPVPDAEEAMRFVMKKTGGGVVRH